MLPAPYRLRLSRDISRVKKSGVRWTTPFFVIGVARPGDRVGLPSRFTVVVSKKVDKRAVRRNLLKRRTRAALARIIAEGLIDGLDVVVTCRQGSVDARVDDIEMQIREALKRGVEKLDRRQ